MFFDVRIGETPDIVVRVVRNYEKLGEKVSFNAETHLKNVIIPYWNSMKDDEHGGFYGFRTYDLEILKKADKGVVLHSRILWFYSNAYMTVGGEENLKNAYHAYQFIRDYCVDRQYGGVYWMMHYDGSVSDSTKNAYNQAFCIYGLSSFYRATGDKEALRLAYSLFECIETYFYDGNAYNEAYTADWRSVVESAICDQGVVATKTMNTLLHIMEAYTELFYADRHPAVAQKLIDILEVARSKVYNSEFERLETFFDAGMSALADIHSYGHDIEASWLLDRACEVLKEGLDNNEIGQQYRDRAKKIIDETAAYTPVVAQKILDCAFDGEALNNECRGEASEKEGIASAVVDTDRIWWVQAEAVVGFVNAWQKSGRAEFRKAAAKIADYIQKVLTDKRAGSEWFWSVTKDGAASDHGITEPWKCPYHNGRMCMELIRRGV